MMDNIQRAAKSLNTITILYRDSKGNVSNREGEPYEIKNNGLYMFCYLRNELRFFKLDNIMDVRITQNKFTPRFPIKI
jgi:predicted DNA-binding transcriptional regulator YafY